MAQIDSSIYFQQQNPDFLGNIQKGLSMRDSMDQRKLIEADRLRAESERQQNAQIQKAYNAGIVQNPDGSTTFDPGKVQGTFAQLAGQGNQFAGKQMFDFTQQQKQQMALEEQRKRDAMKFSGDTNYQNAQIGKLNAETAEHWSKSRAASSPMGKLTDGQKTFDKEYAKDHNEWTSGGAKNARLEIQKLQDVAASLRDGKVSTGGFNGMIPWDRLTSDQLLNARSDVQSSIMNSLRPLLGSAFTEKEGERVIRNTWNEADSTENNLKRLERLATSLENQAREKDAKSQYFEQSGGTLSKFQPITKQNELNQSPMTPMNQNQKPTWAL